MGLRLVKPEEREGVHNSWLAKKIYAKTTLTTFNNCREKFKLRYIDRLDEHWGLDLIEGIGGHKLLENFHLKQLNGDTYYRKEMRSDFEAEMKRLAHRLDSSLAMERQIPDSWSRIMPVTELYVASWLRWYKRVISIEKQWGLDDRNPVVMGGARVAGHLDLEVPDLIVDFKFVGKNSGHRRPKVFDLGMEMYKKGTGADRTAILPLVKAPFSREPKELKPGQAFKGGFMIDGLQEVNHTRNTAKATELIIHDMVSAIERGDLSGGPPEIGYGLCQRKYCDFWGRCKYTKHLPRKGL